MTDTTSKPVRQVTKKRKNTSKEVTTEAAPKVEAKAGPKFAEKELPGIGVIRTF